MRVFSSTFEHSLATMETVNWEIERLLRSREMGSLLQSALQSAGLRLQGWDLERVYSRPLGETSARFQVFTVDRSLTLVASTRELRETERVQLGAIRCESAVGLLHIWAHPADPELPGLLIVEDHPRLEARLAQLLGIEVQIQQSQMLVLRPLRRAVYRIVVRSAEGFRTLFLKVVRPRKLPELLARHRTSTLVPPTADLGDGILAVDQAPGISLAQLLYTPHSPNPGVRISPGVVLSALDSMTSDAMALPAKTPPTDRLESFTDTLAAGGAQRTRVKSLIALILQNVDTSPQPAEPTHGDFHPANLFLSEDGLRAEALIDADTIGPGQRQNDIAMMLAHLIVLPSFSFEGYRTAADTARDLWAATASSADLGLASRTAASLLCIAPGARNPDQLNYYLDVAENLMETGDIAINEHTREFEM